jgi:hypothetical protein
VLEVKITMFKNITKAIGYFLIGISSYWLWIVLNENSNNAGILFNGIRLSLVILLCSAGIGLIKLKNWARIATSCLVGVTGIIASVIIFGFSLEANSAILKLQAGFIFLLSVGISFFLNTNKIKKEFNSSSNQ